MSNDMECLVFVGSLTRPTPYFDTAEGTGLTTWLFNEANGTLRLVDTFIGVDNPTFMALHPRQPIIYAVSEVYGWNEGTVTALRFDRQGGSLAYINKQCTEGSITAHASLDRDGQYLFVTNYAHERWAGLYREDTPRRAVCVFPIGENGSIRASSSSVQHHGTGPVAGRQAEPHPHCAMLSPDGRYLLVTDLGVDTVFSYPFTRGHLGAAAQFKTTPGAGPRHLKFDRAGRYVYLLNELDSTVYCLAYDGEHGSLELIQSASTLPLDAAESNRCSELLLSPDGRFLYAANRGHDSITVFSVGEHGRLDRSAIVSCGGKTPRHMAISPGGRWLLVANQNSHSIAVFSRERETGVITQNGSAEVGTPMAILPIA